MTSNEQTITDSGANKLRGTDRHTSRPEEVLFFANAHFLFFNFTADAHLAHLPLSPTSQTNNRGQSQKSQIPLHTKT
jgi:hypothetical protein